jgi:RHS repeat-associated protein
VRVAEDVFGYDSFGNNAVSARTRYTYTGRERDPDTGLLYYRARFYDPQLGRFISEDPIGLEGGISLFTYVENNPARKSDPSGRCPQDPKPQSRPTPLPDPCNSPDSWNTPLQDWRQLRKSIGWSFADDGTPIDKQNSFNQIKADLDWAGFWES